MSHTINNMGAGKADVSTTRAPMAKRDVIARTKILAQKANIEVNGEMGAIMAAIFTDLRNVYITGGAGTGKTTFLKHVLIQELEQRGVNYHVTASTGIAGSHVDGRTFHSYLGIGLGPAWPPGAPVLNMERFEIEEIYEATFAAWENDPRTNAGMRDGLTRKLCGTEVCILEEVSMISGWGLLGYADFFLRKIRDVNKPFGGIQMIFVGDFGQLPPVERYPAWRPDWAFQCEAWQAANVLPMKFTKIHRQKAGWYTDFLNTTREGIPCGPQDMERLKQHYIPGATPVTYPNYTFLCATNKEVDVDNRAALQQYPGTAVVCPALFDVREEQLKYRDTIESVKRRLVDAASAIRPTLHLKVGLPVLITVNNHTAGYVNGTKGFIMSILMDKNDPESVSAIAVRVPNSKYSQGDREAMTPEEREAIEELDVVHELGRRYWSRSPAEDPELLAAVDPAVFAANTRAGIPNIPRRLFPVVGQFPIIPASAITCHRAQGMSLDAVVIRPERSFACGHVYLAMTRLRSPDGLILTSLDLPIFADPSAAAYNRSIEAFCEDMGEPLAPLDPATSASMAGNLDIDDIEF